jgi:hypothetical protein
MPFPRGVDFEQEALEKIKGQLQLDHLMIETRKTPAHPDNSAARLDPKRLPPGAALMARQWANWWSGNYADESCTNPPFKIWVSGYRDRDTALIVPNIAKAADIVDTAVAAGSFNTLVAAVKAALVSLVCSRARGHTPFLLRTMPRSRSSPQARSSRLKNKVKLPAILKYHLVPGPG